ncbi:putative mitochondrial protein [Tanacetum coccineum]|uniref:Mitochondrial protein n=1 Tax=Tanacetum coccineum TaxID=301880 RepID=A0ABQ4ZWM7_9ASTR
MAPSTRLVTANNNNGNEEITREYLDSQLAEIRNLIAILGLQQNQAMNQGRQANQFGRLAKVEFPKFQGDDVRVHLSDKALLWHRQFLSVNGENVGWEVYKNAIIQRFWSIFEAPMYALKNAKLPTELEMSVRMFKPVTLANAYYLTMLQEAILDAVKKKNKPSGSFNGNRFGNGGNYGNVSKPVVLPKPNTPVTTHVRKQLSQKEYQEKRAQNLCFYCDQKPTGPLAVTVVDGNNLVTTTECKNFQWKFDNTTFTTDVMLLPLGGCEMVLGIQWLATLGDIKCNFKELRMEFKYGGNEYQQKGQKRNKKDKTEPESGKSMKRPNSMAQIILLGAKAKWMAKMMVSCSLTQEAHPLILLIEETHIEDLGASSFGYKEKTIRATNDI